MLSYTVEEMLSRPLEDVVHASDHSAVQQNWERQREKATGKHLPIIAVTA